MDLGRWFRKDAARMYLLPSSTTCHRPFVFRHLPTAQRPALPFYNCWAPSSLGARREKVNVQLLPILLAAFEYLGISWMDGFVDSLLALPLHRLQQYLHEAEILPKFRILPNMRHCLRHVGDYRLCLTRYFQLSCTFHSIPIHPVSCRFISANLSTRLNLASTFSHRRDVRHDVPC